MKRFIHSLVDHIDELYLAELSARENAISLWKSAGIAAVSLAVTLLALPSFWTDIEDLGPKIPARLRS